MRGFYNRQRRHPAPGYRYPSRGKGQHGDHPAMSWAA